MKKLVTCMIVLLTLTALGCRKDDNEIVVLDENYFIGQWTFRPEYRPNAGRNPYTYVFEFAPGKKLLFNMIVDGVRHTIGWEFEEQGRTLRFIQRDPQDFEIIRFSKNEFTAYDDGAERSYIFTRVK